jgi:uncharacterized protein (TIGR01777 family)
MSASRVTLTGATGLIGRGLVAALRSRGAEVTVLTRSPEGARSTLGDIQALAWDAISEPAPAAALTGRDAVLHLAGEPVAQRWSTRARNAIRDSRVAGTRNLIAGLEAARERPGALVASSSVGYYGSHGEEPLDEDAPPGRDFLAQVCAAWEAESARAGELGLRTAILRTGVVLDAGGGALARMLPPFRLGLGGPVAGGSQYLSWIHVEDMRGLMLAALDSEDWEGPVNATAPEPATNAQFSRELGRALSRPAVLPVPAFVLRAVYGEMAQVVTRGARVVPARALMLGYEFRHPRLAGALAAALSG